MQTKITKWGNSLALRIPRAFALSADLKQNELVDLAINKDKIVITLIRPREYSLDGLLKGVSESNLHGEFDTGAPVGKEIW